MRTLGATLTLLGTVAAACGGVLGGSSEISPQDPALVAEGAALYAGYCAECHGADLRGTERGPSHLSRVYEPGHHADGAFLIAVLQGSRQHHWRFGDMEPVPGLTGEDVAAIVAYVREAQRTEGFEPYPP